VLFGLSFLAEQVQSLKRLEQQTCGETAVKRSKRLLKELVKEVAAFSMLVACVRLLWKSNILLFAVSLIMALTVLGFWPDRTRHSLRWHARQSHCVGTSNSRR
jgi:hypothetical protein